MLYIMNLRINYSSQLLVFSPGAVSPNKNSFQIYISDEIIKFKDCDLKQVLNCLLLKHDYTVYVRDSL